MKITINQYDEEHSVENRRDDLDIWEVALMLKALLKLVGFHEDLIDQVIKDEEEEYEEPKED